MLAAQVRVRADGGAVGARLPPPLPPVPRPPRRVCGCVCARARVRACLRACACVCARARVSVCVCGRPGRAVDGGAIGPGPSESLPGSLSESLSES